LAASLAPIDQPTAAPINRVTATNKKCINFNLLSCYYCYNREVIFIIQSKNKFARTFWRTPIYCSFCLGRN